jgi:hypothetical protein
MIIINNYDINIFNEMAWHQNAHHHAREEKRNRLQDKLL